MIGIGKDELFCDLAETYGILEWEGLSAIKLATLSFGLSQDSRIYKKLTGRNLSQTNELIAAAYDAINMLVWLNSADGVSGANRPKSVLKILSGESSIENNVSGFMTADEFEAERSKFMRN